MTSDAQMPVEHATMLSDTSGFQWHVSLKPVTHANGLRHVSVAAVHVAPSAVGVAA